MTGGLSRLWRTRTRRFVLAALTSAPIALALGFVVFVTTLPDPAAADPIPLAFAGQGRAGIVALTGGAGARIERAIDLHEAGLGERVFVSGVNPQIDKADLQVTMGRWQTFECCVDLGPYAKTTKGNALEARSWARSRGFTTVYLVTSNFHLPRAKAELSMIAPELTVIGVPVDSRSVPAGAWTGSARAWMTLGKEYVKFLVVRARWITQPEPMAALG